MLATFGAATVVICRRCTSLVRSCGCRMAISMRSRPAQASIAAEPVSPEVAPTIVTRASRAASTWSNSRPSSCSAMSLNDSVGPWNSSCTNRPVSSWTSGTTAGMAEAGIGVAAQRCERGERDRVADERLDHARGERVVRQAAHRPPVGRRRSAARIRARTARRPRPGRPAARRRSRGPAPGRGWRCSASRAGYYGAFVTVKCSPQLPLVTSPSIFGPICLPDQRDALRAAGDRAIGCDRRIDPGDCDPSGTGTRCRSPRA